MHVHIVKHTYISPQKLAVILIFYKKLSKNYCSCAVKVSIPIFFVFLVMKKDNPPQTLTQQQVEGIRVKEELNSISMLFYLLYMQRTNCKLIICILFVVKVNPISIWAYVWMNDVFFALYYTIVYCILGYFSYFFSCN